MTSFGREKIKMIIRKVSTRKKLLEVLDMAKEGGYLADQWFETAILEKENDLGCNLFRDYIEGDECKVDLDETATSISKMSSQEEIEIMQRRSKYLERLTDEYIFPELTRFVKREKAAAEKAKGC